MAASAYQLPQDKRDNKRQRLLLTATMTSDSGDHEVHLLNISHNGAKIDADLPPMQGEVVTLHYNNTSISARVAWVEGNRFGIAFDQSIDESALVLRGQQHLAG